MTMMMKTATTAYHSDIVNRLVYIFTKQQQQQHQQELLNKFGLEITTHIVETVLKTFKSWRIAHDFFNWASSLPGYKHNCYTYNTMASILSSARQNASLSSLAADVINSRCSMTPGALGYFIRCLGNRGLVQDVDWLFDKASSMGLCNPNSYSYGCLLEALSKCPRSSSIDSVERRLREMRDSGLRPDKYTLTPVLRSYCNAGKFEKVMEVFSEMRQEGWLDAHVVSILAISFSKWGKVDKAMELIERMEEDYNIGFNEKMLIVLVHGFVRESRLDMALHLYHKIRKLGFVPDISVYDVLVGGLCKINEIEKALNLCLEMRSLGIFPDIELVRKLLSNSPGEENVIKLVEEWEDDLGTKATVLLYNSVLQSLVNCGSLDKACRLLQAMMMIGGEDFQGEVVKMMDLPLKTRKHVSPDTISFEIVISGLCKNNNFLDTSLKLFHDMTTRVNCKPSLLIYNNIIHGLSKSGRAVECYKLLIDMKERGIQPTHFTYNAIFGSFCRRGDVTEALSVVSQMRVNGHEPWIKHSTLLVKNLCIDGKVDEASKFLGSLVEQGFLPGMVPYSAVIDGFLKVHQVDRALQLFRDISSRGYCADVVAYNIIINGLCKDRKFLEAHGIFNEMLEKGLIPSVVTYNTLIDGWCKIGDIDNAMLCFSTSLVGKQWEPNVVTCTTLVDGLCNAGRPDDAIRVWNKTRENGSAPNRISFMALVQGLCKCKMPDAAMVYFHEMEDMGLEPDKYIYVALIDTLLSSSNHQWAFDVLKKLVHKGMFPESTDKNYSTLRNAIFKLSEDTEILSGINLLFSEGGIQNFSSLSDFETEIAP